MGKIIFILFIFSVSIVNAQVDIIYGDIPVIVAIEHDGFMQCGSEHDGYLYNDTYLWDYRNIFIDTIRREIGNPYVVRLLCQRRYVDANRMPESRLAYVTDAARMAYYEYHNSIDAMAEDILSRWENGIGLDLHTFHQRKPPLYADVEIGFDVFYADRDLPYNTASDLYEIGGDMALDVFAKHLNRIGIVATSNSSQNGQATVSIHGTNSKISPTNADSPVTKFDRWSFHLDFVQLEHINTAVDSEEKSRKIAIAEVMAIKEILNDYYDYKNDYDENY